MLQRNEKEYDYNNYDNGHTATGTYGETAGLYAH